MDINQLAQALLQALQTNQGAQLQTVDTNRRLHNAQVNNAANASGLLFSTMPFNQQQQALPETLQNTADIRQATATNTIQVQNSVQDALDQIKKLNDAAAELDAL